jgi:phosphoribosyl-AMP cyclohydrolase
LESHQATYWSRSRNELWVKGATSGNTQEVVSASLDCDGDAILLRVNQKGGACHTGSHSCFSNEIEI